MTTVALVTGGNRGIGREVARQLAKRGHTVVLTARSAQAAATSATATESWTSWSARRLRTEAATARTPLPALRSAPQGTL
jgi:NAD(P)-dependent dehydrogenase (short-subunit alcohol dehydrogenase family)